MSVFEKVVGFKSAGLSFRDLKLKVEDVYPNFLSDFNDDRLLEVIYLHWRQRRRETNNSLLR